MSERMVTAKGREAHIDAAGKRVGRKAHLEAELIDAFLETSITAKNDFVLKQSG
jgi:hypothetical protein